ncbi:MAG: DUF6266 family protein [Bacteroidales bacterium]
MARIKTGILGKFTGSINGITGYNLKGQHVVRSKAVNVANPNTAAQQTNRKNLIFAIGIYKMLRSFLQFSLRQRDKNQTVLSEFMRLNLNKSIKNSEIDMDNFIYWKSNAEKNSFTIDIENNTGLLL